MKSIEELQADLKQLYAELEERRIMEQETAAKIVNFHEISSKAERYKIEGHPMSGRDEHEQAMYLLLLLSVAVMDDTVYETSFSLLYRIAHGMGFKGDVQELFVQAAQINFERLDEITRLFIDDEVCLVMLMECMMLAQSFKKEYKKAMEYVAELCILMKLDKDEIVIVSNIARAVLMQDAKEYQCEIRNEYPDFNCYINLIDTIKTQIVYYNEKREVRNNKYYGGIIDGIVGFHGLPLSSLDDVSPRGNYRFKLSKFGNREYHYSCFLLYSSNNESSSSSVIKMFSVPTDQRCLYFRKKFDIMSIRDESGWKHPKTAIAVTSNAPNLAYAYAIQKYKEAGGIIEEETEGV